MKFDIDINSEYEEIQVIIKAPQMTSEITELTKLNKGYMRLRKH